MTHRPLLCAALIAAAPLPSTHAAAAPAERDGQHDFDFELGSWKIHLKRLVKTPAGAREWVEFDGTSVTRKLWGGQAQIEEFDVQSPSGAVRGLTLRIYNPASHQWSLYWANARLGVLEEPPNVGAFHDGVGEFYAHEPIDGKMILVRYAWSRTNSGAPHFEQAFSEDGGKSWEVNWITDQTRVEAP